MLAIKKDLEANKDEDYLLKDIAKLMLGKCELELESV